MILYYIVLSYILNFQYPILISKYPNPLPSRLTSSIALTKALYFNLAVFSLLYAIYGTLNGLCIQAIFASIMEDDRIPQSRKEMSLTLVTLGADFSSVFASLLGTAIRVVVKS